VVTAPGYHPDVVREQFKTVYPQTQRTRRPFTLTRRAASPVREQWWAERGSKRYINSPDELEAAILYVRDGQD
jgi:hypothetical protein